MKIMDCTRLGCESNQAVENQVCKDAPDCRSEFVRDYDRLIFLPTFRKLLGKTQVFPLPKSDQIHTRLTHSLEVASVGRSLGELVYHAIENEVQDYSIHDVASVISAACLAHDIGNPPFGHSGEKAISEFFRSSDGKTFIENMPECEKRDFESYEGNAMGMYILTHSNPNITRALGGLGLTYSTLAAFSKYPCSSIAKVSTKNVCQKKPGLLFSSINDYAKVAKKLEIPCLETNNSWSRHPFAFLTEAADDICYRVLDLEDGYRYKLIEFKEAEKILTGICKDLDENIITSYNNVIDPTNKIAYLRAKAVSSLTMQVGKEFIKHKDKLMNGKYEKPLIDTIKSKKSLEKIMELLKGNVYNAPMVLQIEAAGFEVLYGLLKKFLNAVKDERNENSKKVKQLLPSCMECDFKNKPYETIVSILCYVAGMTDRWALDTYRTLYGYKFVSD